MGFKRFLGFLRTNFLFGGKKNPPAVLFFLSLFYPDPERGAWVFFLHVFFMGLGVPKFLKKRGN